MASLRQTETVIDEMEQLLDRRPAQRLRRVGFRQRQPLAWAGFRGAVSLAAALAIPLTATDGEELAGRCW